MPFALASRGLMPFGHCLSLGELWLDGLSVIAFRLASRGLMANGVVPMVLAFALTE